ncbi:cytochrome c oxidase subunit II [Humisphaera borealis]|uniref:Uncharacterized protein n=1 Tax=Humisphaera borealis TaxID=2807512 RepID=A0A7M2WTW0_9BACT|nr:hypothetical protein [Humisphaera borealis]QOV88957.1 hypothetical protein IPV69_22450 [Humisphaera borealis]
MTLGYYSPTGQDASGYVMQPIPCRGCGQALQGLHEAHRCPQCGIPAGRSVQPGILRFAPPTWLGVVRSGLLLEFWTIITIIVLSVIGIAGGIVWVMGAFKSSKGPPDFQAMMGRSPLITVAIPIIGVIVSGLLTYGIWLITTPEPQPGAAYEGPKTRQTARGLALFSFAISATSVVIQMAGLLGDPIVVGVVQSVATLVSASSFVALLLVLAELSAYVPDIKLAARARTTGWCGGIGMAVMGAMQVLTAVMVGDGRQFASRGTPPGGAFMVAGCFNALVGLFVVVCYIIYLVTLYQVAGRVRQAKDYSQSILQQPKGQAPVPAQPVSPMPPQEL